MGGGGEKCVAPFFCLFFVRVGVFARVFVCSFDDLVSVYLFFLCFVFVLRLV